VAERPSSARETYGARLASAGVSLKEIAWLIGDTDLRTTQIYAHLEPGALSDSVLVLKLPDEWATNGTPRSWTAAESLTGRPLRASRARQGQGCA